ncbi:MAG: c-type cytochrome [Rhodospirillales bacterium]|nr:c-type cytochrome [Rhodospirillales bacterium]
MSLEVNKIAAAVLTGGIVAMLSGFVAGKLYHPETLEEPAYKIALPEGGGEDRGGPPKEESILPLLANANPEAGAKAATACKACHSFEDGGPNKLGPNLWGIVGSEPADVAGYRFSDALNKLKQEGKTWTYEDLDRFLKNPGSYAPGTKMAYAGMKPIGKRADLIAYLRTLSTDPVPLPTAAEIGEAAAASKTEEPAEETQVAVAAAAPVSDDKATAAGGGGSELARMIEDGDIAAGKKVARKCIACHSFEEGGPNKVGPNLYNIIGAVAGKGHDYKFSKALEAKGTEGFTWTYEHLDAFIEAPKKYIPGSKMAFAGVRKAEQRADLIAYIRSLAKNPPPLPK